jgi:scyllo-inositol 2-dehydrogenase (NADP+)
MRSLIVGLGTQGKKRRAFAGSDVVATVDPVAGAADYRSVDEVPRQLYDAALVCTPDSAKPAILRYLLANGKHVLVEKPLLGREELMLQDLAALARKSGAVCYTAYNHRFEPHVSRLKDIIDSGSLGTLYAARFFYGNGTAHDVSRSPWRDDGLGVLADLGSHLLDLSRYLLGGMPESLQLWQGLRAETRAYDHCVFGSPAAEKGMPALEFTVSLLSWRNTFTIDIIGAEGSAHVNGLCKWGPSRLIVRDRVLPSGVPTEEVETLRMPDPTWQTEYVHFGVQCRSRLTTDLRNDIWIQNVLGALDGRTPRREAA